MMGEVSSASPNITNYQLTHVSMNTYMNSSAAFALSVVVASVLFWSGIASAQTATISTSLDIGSRGANVITLQTFLASDSTLYPEGLVTGYYGPLTAAAVQRFQCRQAIVCSGTAATTGYGRVGPRTRAALNVAFGGGIDVFAPRITNLVVSTTTNGATLTWFTNESARGTVYFSSSPLPIFEGSASTGAVVGGQVMIEPSVGFSHSLALSGLASNTLYFYAVKSEDASGNVQLTWPSTFRTNP